MAEIPHRNDSLVALIAENIVNATDLGDLARHVQSVVAGTAKMSGAWVEGARDALKEGNDAKAMKRGILAIMAAPKSARARSLARSQRFADVVVLDDIRNALDSILEAPEDANLYQRFATLLRRAKHPDIAALGYCQALVLDRDDEESARSLAAILRDQGHLEAGLSLTSAILKEKPRAAWIWVQHGNILNRMEKHADAIEAFQKALTLDPKISGIRSAIARANGAMGEHDRAIEEYRAAVEEDPGDYRLLEALADEYAEVSSHGHAVLWYRRVLARRDSQRVREKLQRGLLELGHWDAASGLMEKNAYPNGGKQSWSGKLDPNTTLIVDAGGGDQPETIVAATAVTGIQFAQAGQPIVMVCSAALANLLAPVAPKKVRFFNDIEKARSRLPRADIVTLDDISVGREAVQDVLKNETPPLAALRRRTDAKPLKIGFITEPQNEKDVADPKLVSGQLPKGMKVTSHKQKARESIERTVPLLDMLDRVITDDPMTAILAAATGCPSVFVVGSGQSGQISMLSNARVFGPRQIVVRMTGTESDAMRAASIARIIGDDFRVPEHVAQVDLAGVPQQVRETIAALDENVSDHALNGFEVAELDGGTRNAAYRLSKGDRSFVMRMGRFPVPQEGFYAKESRNMRIAADAGLAPRVWHTDALDGSMLIDFVDGEVMRTKTLSLMDNAVDAAKLLREVHKLPGFRGSFDILSKIDRNVEKLRRDQPDLLKGYGASVQMMEHISKVLRDHRVPHYATHNDPLTRNFIRASDGRMMLIDWECSAVADPHWEVAALSSQCRFPPDVWQAYVTSYFGDAKHPAMCRVALYEALCRFYWWTDGLVESAKADDPKKAVKDATVWNKMYADIVGSEGFKRALSKAEDYTWSFDHSPLAM